MSPYEILLSKVAKITIKILCIEIYEAINKINPEFMNKIFKINDNDRLVQEKQ